MAQRRNISSTRQAPAELAHPAAVPGPEEVYSDPPEPILTSPIVARYLQLLAALVFAIVVVGGLTRLTESGLSITEWNVVSGIRPPSTAEEWEIEFAKYRDTPEWRLSNRHITLSDFQTIFYWEWAHRILGRVIGLTFLLPIPYFIAKRKISRRTGLALLGIGSLIGAQGALGWYMVKSGLDQHSVDQLGGVPRVSQYRLAAHLGMAFAVYTSCIRLAGGILRDWRAVHGDALGKEDLATALRKLGSAQTGRLRMFVTAVTGLVFLTAVSGAFVAGLDAGLLYNTFPLMGGRLVPPTSELYSDDYRRKGPDGEKGGIWRNVTENPVTVQFDHRLLAITTFSSIVALFLLSRRPAIRAHLPRNSTKLIMGTLHMSLLQVALGISTLVYLVPVPLAAMHQAGSLVLLTLALGAGAALRRPSKVVREILRMRAERMQRAVGRAQPLLTR